MISPSFLMLWFCVAAALFFRFYKLSYQNVDQQNDSAPNGHVLEELKDSLEVISTNPVVVKFTESSNELIQLEESIVGETSEIAIDSDPSVKEFSKYDEEIHKDVVLTTNDNIINDQSVVESESNLVNNINNDDSHVKVINNDSDLQLSVPRPSEEEENFIAYKVEIFVNEKPVVFELKSFDPDSITLLIRDYCQSNAETLKVSTPFLEDNCIVPLSTYIIQETKHLRPNATDVKEEPVLLPTPSESTDSTDYIEIGIPISFENGKDEVFAVSFSPSKHLPIDVASVLCTKNKEEFGLGKDDGSSLERNCIRPVTEYIIQTLASRSKKSEKAGIDVVSQLSLPVNGRDESVMKADSISTEQNLIEVVIPITVDDLVEKFSIQFNPYVNTPVEVAKAFCEPNVVKFNIQSREMLNSMCIGPVSQYITSVLDNMSAADKEGDVIITSNESKENSATLTAAAVGDSKLVQIDIPIAVDDSTPQLFRVSFDPAVNSLMDVATAVCKENKDAFGYLDEEELISECIGPISSFLRSNLASRELDKTSEISTTTAANGTDTAGDVQELENTTGEVVESKAEGDNVIRSS